MFALIAALSLTSAFAVPQTTETSVTINTTVVDTCVFDTSATTEGSLNYSAASSATTTGSAATASLYCNAGAIPSASLSSTTLSVTTDQKTTTGTVGGGLVVDLTLSGGATSLNSNTSYPGAVKRIYSVTPSAAPGQWGATGGINSVSATIYISY